MKTNVLKECGFDTFIQGKFGNAGQNMYVSKKGVLQRIHLFDVNGDGYIDLPLVNSQDDEPRMPAYVYLNPLENNDRVELPTEGAFTGAVGDLNNDGYDDLVIGNQYNGVSNYVYAQIYYGSPEGYSTKHMLNLWAPSCKSVTIGDFTGDGNKDIAFVSLEKLRVFYQEPRGFHTKGYIDLDLDHTVDSVVAADLDGDGYDDMIIRTNDSTIVIYWGGTDGIQTNRRLWLDSELTGTRKIIANIDRAASGANSGDLFVYQVPQTPRLKIVSLGGVAHLFICREGQSLFVPFSPDRNIGEPLILDSGEVTSAAVGDIRGIGGAEDIVLTSRQQDEDGREYSWIYWDQSTTGSAIPSSLEAGEGSDLNLRYTNEGRTFIDTYSAFDVVVADLDGDGHADVVVCQGKTDTSYTFESLIYKGSAVGIEVEPRRLETHFAVSVFVTRTMDADRPQLIFVNHLSNHIRGDIPAYIYLGGPDGFSTERKLELPGWAATQVRICDYDDDGLADIFIANCNENAMQLDNGSYIYYNSPEGFDEINKIELPTKFTMSSCCADLNRDGWLDLIVAGHNNAELLIFFGSEQGYTDEPMRIKLEIGGRVYNQPRYMSLADLNHDGWLDLVIPQCGPAENTIILWGSEDGFSIERHTLLPASPAICSRVADLNGDGWLDLVIGGYKGPDTVDPFGTFVYIYWGGPDGYANDRRTQLPAHFAADLAIADFNNDGILDIFVACYHGTRTRDLDSYIYWGEPGGIYSVEKRTRIFAHSAAGALAADFNEDGYIDLAVANHKTFGNHPGLSHVWWNGPEGFNEHRITKLPTQGPHGITHSDIGNVMDRGAEEFYESRAIQLPAESEVTGISWSAEIPDKTWVRAQIRTGSSKEALYDQPWHGVDGEGSWFDGESRRTVGELTGTWVQYRLALGAVNSGSTPRVKEVSLYYQDKVDE